MGTVWAWRERVRITKKVIDDAAPRAAKYALWDDAVPGLTLRVMPSGVKSWVLRYRTQAGIQRDHTIGRAEAFHPEDARAEARRVLVAAGKGEDPTQARREARSAAKMEELRDRYLAEHAKTRKKARSAANDEILWRLWIMPECTAGVTFAGWRVADVTTGDVMRWHAANTLKRPITANRALEVLSKAMGLAELWGIRPKGSNPCDGVEANPERKRRRYLKPNEARAIFRALIDCGTTPERRTFAELVVLLLLTGARLRELMCCRWEWVDVPARLIRLPDSKTGERDIILNDDAVTLLNSLPRTCEWVFPGEQRKDGGYRPVSGYRKMWLALLKAAGVTNLRVHDLRHSFASYGISAGLTLPQIGGLLGHASPQTTARYAHLIDEAARSASERAATSIKQVFTNSAAAPEAA